ncbi:calcium-binding protein [Streptomyces yaizuensis]|uniref:Calcium-binding protein n=1 Tax=Streptomyces yaizuensis TaxID=2989713 RepID=A0ABQ5NWZ9_9ACTN|nr:calcium-binding protein [Streptomyces sp. YSPA8]GLF94904.1 calcium-binding protein [Streptomyces sp. YSPA8]
MRFRLSAGVASGALALSALSVPAAQADIATGERAASAGVTVSNVVVNKGKPIVAGTHARQRIAVTYTARDDSGIYSADTTLWHGRGPAAANDWIFSDGDTKCGAGTAPTCTAYFIVDPQEFYQNKIAGNGWKVEIDVYAEDSDDYSNANAKGFSILRAAKLTANASPEPVRKGKTITVTGRLTHANWETYNYTAYGSQSVKLQFRKKGAKDYSTVKTIKSAKNGDLSTTVKASADGAYRYSFAGSTITSKVDAVGDTIDVR